MVGSVPIEMTMMMMMMMDVLFIPPTHSNKVIIVYSYYRTCPIFQNGQQIPCHMVQYDHNHTEHCCDASLPHRWDGVMTRMIPLPHNYNAYVSKPPQNRWWLVLVLVGCDSCCLPTTTTSERARKSCLSLDSFENPYIGWDIRQCRCRCSQ